MYRLSTRVDINSRKITPFQTFQNALSMYRTSNEHNYACKAKYILCRYFYATLYKRGTVFMVMLFMSEF